MICRGDLRHLGFIMKSIVTCFFLLASFFIVAHHAYAGDLPRGDFSGMENAGMAVVSNIIDAQTIELDDGRLVRLVGIDLPDLTYQDAGEFAEITHTILKDMLLGQTVTLHQTPTKDLGRMNRMGHYLMHVERQADHSWVQGTLIGLGLARARTGQRNPQMAKQMLGLEELARWEKIGIWEDDTGYKILTPEEAEEHIRSFAIVRGTVRSTSTKASRIYLNFGTDWKTDFTVSIPPGEKRHFSKQNIDPLQWGGKTVEVRGWLDSYNGAFMEINHPEAIRVLKEAPTP